MADQTPNNRQNGALHGLGAPQPAAGRPRRFSRPFTLPEALPYSPFSSVIPFHADIIPTPILGSGSPTSAVSDLASRDDFDAMNKEAANPVAASQRLQQSLDQVGHLLHPDRLPRYTFRQFPNISTTATPPSKAPKDLSPFSQMVYDKANVAVRYPTPETPTSSTLPNGQSSRPQTAKQRSPLERKRDLPKPVNHAAVNAQAHAHNSAKFELVLPNKSPVEVASSAMAQAAVALEQLPETIDPSQPVARNKPDQPLVPAPESSPQVQKQASIAIELPRAPNFKKEEYQVMEDDPEEPTDLSTRRQKSEGYENSQDFYRVDLNQRQRAEAALEDLHAYLNETFEAEVQLFASGSSPHGALYLIGEQEASITAAGHQRAQTLIQKSISLGSFANVPIQDLLHLQKLSEGGLRYAEGLDLKIEESWGPAEVDAWVQQLPAVETGLKAARTALRLMCGGRPEKPLYSEDAIQLSLNLFRNVMDGILVPIAEMRSSGPSKEIFDLLSPHKKAITGIFTNTQRLFSLMSTLISSTDLSETVSNMLEFAASRLIFVENAHSERDSVVGVHTFDGLRLVAMDMLSQIFLMNPDQRQGIFDEILTSLEKLPVGKRARQFKLTDGRAIQPVSALIMRLVQASAGKVDETRAKTPSRVLQSMEDDDQDPLQNGHTGQNNGLASVRSEEHAGIGHSAAIQELQDMASPLVETSKRNASYVVNFMVKRALKSTKTGDTPYRNLLDLFVEDFVTCLDSPDWPAAELLLRLLMMMAVKLVENDKSSAPAKNMALELIGTMCAAISKLRSHVRKMGNTLDTVEADELGSWLSELAAAALEMKFRPEHMVAWSGPFRATLEYLEERCIEDPHLTSAISYTITEWANRIATSYDSSDDDVPDRDAEFGKVAYRLRMMIQDRRWLTSEYTFKTISPNHAKLSYCIILLRSQFCESFNAILNMLLGSMASDQATVRSKSLRSINQVLETDPSILDGDSAVMHLILQCSNDSSTQVRDAALGLIGKCISMRPALEERMIETVTQRFTDTGVGVRKRAMKLAKDIYLRNHSRSVRSTIANGLLHRVQDPDEGVRELARQMIEEIWINPFYSGEGSAAYDTSMTAHVALMVQTVKQGNVTNVLDKVFQAILSPESKTAGPTFEVCKKLVASMFDLVDNPDSEDSSIPSGRDALQVLMIFAKADSKLFTFEQIRLLKPHVASVGSSEDLTISRAVVVIYRRVLPQLSSVHAQFLADVRKELLPAVSKITRTLLDDVIACLWIISGRLETSEHLARLVSSSLTAIQKIRILTRSEPMDERKTKQFDRYSLIVGMAGKHCDLDSHQELFKKSFPNWQGSSVSRLMVDVLIPFATPKQTLDVRKAALDAVGLVCQSWPRNYVIANVYTAFQQVFDEQNPALETMILRSFKEFLQVEEKRSEQSAEGKKSLGNEPEKKRELTVMGGTNYDDVASATTQRFLGYITRITLASQDELAFLAVEVLASINRQGLVHPKETGMTLITLETSAVPRIAELAYHEHRALHEKHETVLEREYVKAIQAAFVYQRDVVGDPRGATINPFTPKLQLMMEVLKISKSKNRQRFFEKLCAQVDFDLVSLDVSQAVPEHVQFSRFVTENLAFVDYMTIGEVLATVSAMEKVVNVTGAGVAHAIESEVLQVGNDFQPSQPLVEGQDGAAAALPLPLAQVPYIDSQRLRQLTAGSMILLALWEARSYLRRLHNLGNGRNKSKAASKDLLKAPLKLPNVSGEKVWDDIAHIMTGLSSPERMMEQCKAFVEVLNIDKDFKAAAEDDDDMDMDDPGTPPSGDDDDDDEAGRGRKRKANSTSGGRKKRPRSSSQPRKRGRPRKNPVETAPVAADADAEYEEDDLLF